MLEAVLPLTALETVLSSGLAGRDGLAGDRQHANGRHDDKRNILGCDTDMLQHHVSRRDSDDMAQKHTVQMQPTGSNLLAESEWFRSDELFRELVPESSRVYQKNFLCSSVDLA